MLPNNQKNRLKTSDAQADVSARALNVDSAGQEKKSDRDKKFLLLVLLIMFLVITQMIVLLATSGIDTAAEPEIINDYAVYLDDIKSDNDDLNSVMKSLYEIVNR